MLTAKHSSQLRVQKIRCACRFLHVANEGMQKRECLIPIIIDAATALDSDLRSCLNLKMGEFGGVHVPTKF